MTRTYCDICNEEINESNPSIQQVVSDFWKIDTLKIRFDLQINKPKDLCTHCFIDHVNTMDDRAKEKAN